MKKFVLLNCCLALAGCGLKHQVVRLDIPATYASPAQGKVIVIANVQDARMSIFGVKLSATEQARNIGGVLRGGNGIAVDIEGETVADQTRQIATEALRGMGYKVVTGEAGDLAATRISFKLIQFEVNMPFDFWRAATYSQHMLADLKTDVVVASAGGPKTITVVGHGENVYQRVTSENWQIAINKAIVDYTKHLQQAMSNID
ncbi:MAG: hypothetical protein ABI858_09810 [Pseudoxanthomonas sp.]